MLLENDEFKSTNKPQQFYGAFFELHQAAFSAALLSAFRKLAAAVLSLIVPPLFSYFSIQFPGKNVVKFIHFILCNELPFSES